jgi:hypothetical protein
VAAVVGNEDGAHSITASLFQGLNDAGLTVPAQGGVYWNGDAMTGTDYKDLSTIPEAVSSAQQTLAANAAHLAQMPRSATYPAVTDVGPVELLDRPDGWCGPATSCCAASPSRRP